MPGTHRSMGGTQSGQSSAIRALPCSRLAHPPVFSVLRRFPFYREILLKIPGFKTLALALH